MTKIKLKLKNKEGFKKDISDLVKSMNSHKIELGVFGEDGSNIVIYASANEFGARIPVTAKMRRYLASQGMFLKATTKFIQIPERSYLRSAIDDNKSNIEEFVRKTIQDVTQRKFDDKTALDRIGLYLVSLVQKKILSNVPPANHPFTVQQKDSTHTLIDTGRLLQSIKFKIVRKES
jgi:hypothetical protein